MTSSLSVADLLGPWNGDDPTGLMQRCRTSWDVPLESLSDLMIATFLNQKVAEKQMLIEAKYRVDKHQPDGTEYFDGQLLEAVQRTQSTD